MLTLGLNDVYDEASACLIEDGHIVAAVEDERFDRTSRAWRFRGDFLSGIPFEAIAWCLKKRRVRLSDIDHVAYAWDPALFYGEPAASPLPILFHNVPSRSDNKSTLWEAWRRTRVANARVALTTAYPDHLTPCFTGDHSFSWHFIAHQEASAAAAYFTSPFDHAAVLCLNVGSERASTTYAVGQGFTIHSLQEVLLPHSLGLLYQQVTEHIGFLKGGGEAQVMGLVASGRPRYREAFAKIISVEKNGQYRIAQGDLVPLLGPRRKCGEKLEPRHRDIACSLQEAQNEAVIHLAEWLKEQTQSRALVLAGSLALNCVLNSAVRDAGIFEKVWVPPAVGDSGTAVGAALLVDMKNRVTQERYRLSHTCLGPQFSVEDIEEALHRSRLVFGRPPAISVAVAARLASGKIVAWFQGALEFGPNALGSRSILASPMDPDMTKRINQLKNHEEFQPIAVSVTAESVGDWFADAAHSPFMSFVSPIREDKRPRIPAAAHTDGTARVQTVDRDTQALFHSVIEAFGALTGVPVLLNTSFNTFRAPMVCSPAEAIACYASTPIDALALGPFLLEKAR